MQFKQIKNDLIKALAANKPKTAPYDTEAQVVRVEGSTAWVHIPGGVDETPVALTINASAGDTVRVRVGNGTAWLVGNDTAPPTDDTLAQKAIDEFNIRWAKIGTAIIETLIATGINADWINTGALAIYDDDDNEIFRADKTDKIFRWNMGRSEMTDNGSLTLYDGGDFGTQASFNIENTELLNLARLTLKSHTFDMWDSTGTVNANIQPTGIYIGGGNYGTIFNVSPSAGSYGSGSAHCEINGHDLEYWIENLNKEDYTLSFSGSSSYFGTPSTWSVYARKSINTVQFQFNINMNVKDTSTTERVFTTLPSKYRPYRDMFKILEAQTGNRVILIIQNNGNVGLMNISGAAFTGFIRDSITWVK